MWLPAIDPMFIGLPIGPEDIGEPIGIEFIGLMGLPIDLEGPMPGPMLWLLIPMLGPPIGDIPPIWPIGLMFPIGLIPPLEGIC